MLLGRDVELTHVGDLLTSAQLGRSGALLIEGEPGSGKTALLDAARADAVARGFTVLASRGQLADAEVAFAGLLGLLRPVEHHIDELEAPLANGLRSALALERDGTDPTTVRVATFRLLARAAMERPLLVVVDDAAWIDAASSDALGFALRRFDADGVAVLLANSSTSALSWFGDGQPVLHLGPLDRSALAHLIGTSRTLEEGVLDACIAATGGNPLAFRELVGSLDAGQRSGAAALPRIPEPSAAIQFGFAHRLEVLGAPLQRALVVVAADDTGDRDVIDAALARLGEPPVDIEAAEVAGIVDLEGAAITFCHPLLRAVAYHGVAVASRRAAHTALAAVLDQPHQAEARAWQLAAAVTGPDADVADGLELVARAAARRGGTASAARTMERAALLSPDPDACFCRRAEAVAWWLDAGERGPAMAISELLGPSATSNPHRVVVAVLLGAIARLSDGPAAAADRLLGFASSVDGGDRSVLVLLAAEALSAAGERDRAAFIASSVEGPPWARAFAGSFGQQPTSSVTDLLTGASLDHYPVPTPDLVVAALVLHASRVLSADGRDREAVDELDHVFLVPEAGTGPLRLDAAVQHAISRARLGDPVAAAADLSRRLESMPNPSPSSRRLAQSTLASLATAIAETSTEGSTSSTLAARALPGSQDGRDPLGALTAGERRVAEVVGAGQSNRQAGESLFLSVKTVDYHLQNIYRKLGLRSRAELAVLVTGAYGAHP